MLHAVPEAAQAAQYAPRADIDPVDLAVGARIRLRRRALRLSQSELATHLGVTFQQVQKYENGANRTSASMLARIADKLETTVGYYFGETSVETGFEVYDPLIDLMQTKAGFDLVDAAALLPIDRLRALVKVAQSLTVLPAKA